MNCWECLEISATDDRRKIKQAYARLLQKHHPEDDPAAFQKIRAAYEEALTLIERIETDSSPAIDPLERRTGLQETGDPAVRPDSQHIPLSSVEKETSPDKTIQIDPLIHGAMQQVMERYKNFDARRDAPGWRTIFEQQSAWPEDVKRSFGFYFFNFLGDYPWVPPSVWAIVEDYFDWRNQQPELCEYFSEDMVAHLIWRLDNYRWMLDYDRVPLQKEIDYDAYLYHRELTSNAIVHGDLDAALNNLQKAEAILSDDRELQRLAVYLYARTGQYQEAVVRSEQLIQKAPDYLDGYLHHAHLLFKQDRTEAAIEAFEKVLRAAPGNPDGQLGLSRCYIVSGRLFEAQDILKDMLDKHSDYAELRMEMMRLCHLLEEKISSQIETDAVDPQVFFRLSQAYFYCGMPKEALETITIHLNNQPDGAVCLLWARVLAALKHPEEALQQFDQAQSIIDERTENFPELMMHRGIFQYNQKNFESAVDDLNKARKQYSPTIVAKVWYHLADAYRILQNHTKTIELLNQLIETDSSSDWKVFNSRGLALFHTQKYTLALQDFQWALECDDRPESRMWMGACLVELKEYEPAMEALKTAERHMNFTHTITYYQARCAFALQDYIAAQTQIDRCLDAQPDNHSYLRLAGYINLASGNKPKAMKYFVQLATSGNALAMDYIRAAHCCWENRQLDETISFYEQFLNAAPDADNDDSLRVRLHLGELYFLLKNYGKSLSYIDEYIEKQAYKGEYVDAVAHYLRGRSLYFCGDSRLPESVAELQQACDKEICDMAFCYLALARVNTGDVVKAEAIIRKYTAKKNPHPDIIALSKEIKKLMGKRWFKLKRVFSNPQLLWVPSHPEPLYTLRDFPDYYN